MCLKSNLNNFSRNNNAANGRVYCHKVINIKYYIDEKGILAILILFYKKEKKIFDDGYWKIIF